MKQLFLLKKQNNYRHIIIVEEPEVGGSFVIPFLINGVSSYFTCRNLTLSEYEDGGLPRIDLSAEAPDWDPSDWDYTRREEAMMDFSSVVVN